MSMAICPFKDCHTIVTHGHGTSTKYLPKPDATDEPRPGSLDAILYAAYRAGRADAIVSDGRVEPLRGFRTWKRNVLP